MKKFLKKTLISVLLGAALLFAMPLLVWAAEPEVSRNVENMGYGPDQYRPRGEEVFVGWSESIWDTTKKSYLCANQLGGLTRVEYKDWPEDSQRIIVEDYDANFQLSGSHNVAMELPIWGGFFAGKDYNFFIFGQNNEEESDSVEVMRVVKYSRDWQRLGQASLYGANTIHPFRGGTVRCTEYNGMLYIHTCHEMYTTSDGLNHQANMNIAVRQSDMKITDASYKISNNDLGYISHSFSQFVLVNSNGYLVTLDHGDDCPRSLIVMRYANKAGGEKFSGKTRNTEFMAMPGEIGANYTGVTVGGFAETSVGYVSSYTWNDDFFYTGKESGFFLAFTNKNSMQTSSVKLMDLPNYDGFFGGVAPRLVPTGLDGGYAIWSPLGTQLIYYAVYNAEGKIGAINSAEAWLSDCQPIIYKGQAVWYATADSAPVFYLLGHGGLTTIPANDSNAAAKIPQTTASAANVGNSDGGIKIMLNGQPLAFEQAPYTDNGSTMVPMRVIFEALGAGVDFDAAGRKITATKGETVIELVLGQKSAIKNGQTINLDVPADTRNGSTMVPLRFVAEALRAQVDWDNATQTVSISQK